MPARIPTFRPRHFTPGQPHTGKQGAGQPSPRPTRRASAAARGYNAAWRRLRIMILHRDPVCKMCHRRPSRHVDHITPLDQGGRNTGDNLQGLCHGCHSRKTRSEHRT